MDLGTWCTLRRPGGCADVADVRIDGPSQGRHKPGPSIGSKDDIRSFYEKPQIPVVQSVVQLGTQYENFSVEGFDFPKRSHTPP